MWLKTSLAGSATAGTFLKSPCLQKNQRLLVLTREVVLITLACQLNVELILDGNVLGSQIGFSRFQGIFPSDTTPPLVEADKQIDEQNYLLWMLQGSIEIPKGEAIPLEYNLAGLSAISFDKGCYLGQEVVARTHHWGVIRKRLLPLG